LSPQILLVASLSVAVLLVAVFVILAKRRSSTRGNSLILTGPPDAGKTAIFSTLIYNETLPSHTSLQSNFGILSLPKHKPLLVIDIPGHPRVRSQISEYLHNARVVVFVVDTSTISRNGPAVAEHLHSVMNTIVSLPPSQTLPQLVILAHKSDLLRTGAGVGDDLAINRVKVILERELEKRRLSQTAVGVESLGEEGERSEFGGLDCSGPGGVFRFSEWDGGQVVFLSTSCPRLKGTENEPEKQDTNGLESLLDWL
ncbi:hypothetical protein FISHEDRAFT_10799, partial [Fistulina hepatica ATCC 64428]